MANPEPCSIGTLRPGADRRPGRGVPSRDSRGGYRSHVQGGWLPGLAKSGVSPLYRQVSDLLGPGADAVIGYWAALMGLTLQPIEIICLVATLVPPAS